MLSKFSRICILLGTILLVCAFVFPLWRIDLFAPQYPEGLTMKIWYNNLTGDVDVINGLNHYIGMKHISKDMFPEFSIIQYAIIFYIIFGLLIVITGSRQLLFWFIVFTLFGGTFSMFDFYRWAYEYGHNLDPNAAIKVPGLSYQPPIFGHKRLLNFDAYSFPDIGGWVVIIGAALTIFIYIFSYVNWSKKYLLRVIPILLLPFLSSCKIEPEPIVLGQDVCAFCKMNIVDLKFASELVSDKGKVWKFDDLGCMRKYLADQNSSNLTFKLNLTTNYLKPGEWINTANAIYVRHPAIHSPMNYNVAAFQNEEVAKKEFDNIQEVYTWKDLPN